MRYFLLRVRRQIIKLMAQRGIQRKIKKIFMESQRAKIYRACAVVQQLGGSVFCKPLVVSGTINGEQKMSYNLSTTPGNPSPKSRTAIVIICARRSNNK